MAKSTRNEQPLMISVVGGNEPSEEAMLQAEMVGRELAQRGIIVVCGGLGGVMEAVCRGAKAEGGVTVGVLPGSDPREANPHVDIPICTGMGYARNSIVVKTGQAVIAIGGAYGTLSEIAFALGDGTPVIGLMTWELYRFGHAPDTGITYARNAEEAVELAVAAANLRAGANGHDHNRRHPGSRDP